METKTKLTKREYFVIALCILAVVSIALVTAVTTILGKGKEEVSDDQSFNVHIVTKDNEDLVAVGSNSGDTDTYGGAQLIYPVGTSNPDITTAP